MSSPPNDVSLSRAISEIDLNVALKAVQAQAETGPRYTKDTLLALRPKIKSEKDVEHVEIAEVSPDTEGLMTPPYHAYPKPPPPTPATPINGASVGASANGIEAADTNVANINGSAPVVVAEQPKKKKKKSSGKNKKPNPTGFEEFYADPPTTPDEHEEECDLYHETRPFADRMETCIQRYRARRKLDEVRSNILTKYFMLGGVDSTSKAFTGGLDKETVENSTAAEIAAIQASDFLQTGSKNAKYYDGSDGWVVDFESVVKGYFSHRVPRLFPLDSEDEIKTIVSVIRNFLNYVLQHAVCPEYTENVMAARFICEVAEKELWCIKQLASQLPGDFNVSASILYGGKYEAISLDNAAWGGEDADLLGVDLGISVLQAERIFKTGIAFAGTDELFVETMKADVHITKTESKYFEVVGIERASLLSIEEYAAIKDHNGNAGFIKALGVIKMKAWGGPGFDEDDLTDAEAEAAKAALEEAGDTTESFWLEDELLQYCFVGMKVDVVVRELNIGIKFFDVINGIYCSFHTVLPNEKMVGWKEPVPNTRPPPTVEDPEVEERAFEAIMEDDLKQDQKEFEGKK
ncbi:Argonaute siRNA chaperone complex subunit Arb1-domain-containing protein [Leptodontidium sp. MPI-SDFR-AT-0119]|nr:Argonaute siRNA chaperone complex subunit Arb1-domain-containing protein [Leptodontidium sp. MPI-SDFR-AT-0119]